MPGKKRHKPLVVPAEDTDARPTKNQKTSEAGDAAAERDDASPDTSLSDRFSKLFGAASSNAVGVSSLLTGDADPASFSTSVPLPAARLTPQAPIAPAMTKRAVTENANKKKGPDGDAVPLRKKRSEAELKERERRTLFVGNVPLKWTKADLRRALRKAVGEKYSEQFKPIWFRAEPLEGKFSGKLRKVGSIIGAHAKGASDAKNAYVVLASPDDVKTVRYAVHGTAADESHVLRADGCGEAAKLQTFDRKKSVFVGNLPGSTSESDLRSLLAPAGEVDAVRVVRDSVWKACKGIAFVRFKERKSVKAALELWGVELQGRPIRVMKVTQTEGDQKANSSNQAGLHPAERRMARRGNAWQRSSGAPRKPRKPRFDGGGRGAKTAKSAKNKTKAKKAKVPKIKKRKA